MTAVPWLVLVTDRHAARRAGRSLVEAVTAGLDGGAPAVLLRDKDLATNERWRLGDRLRTLTEAAGARFLVASDPVLARHLEADGLHLAAADPPSPERFALTGRSAHDDAEVESARREAVSYAFVSPVAPTPSKPGHGPTLAASGLRALVAGARGLPLLALGGVTPDNVAIWRQAGASGIAVMGGVLAAPDPAATVQALHDAWTAVPPPTPPERA